MYNIAVTAKADQGGTKLKKGKKKKGIVRYILLIILLLILAAIVAAVIYFYSFWRTAKNFERDLDLAHFTYGLDVELEWEGLTIQQRAFIGTLARISGMEQEEFLQMHVEGSVWEDKVYAEVFPAGMDVPLMEFYLSSGDDLINTSLFYDAVRNEAVGKYAFLEGLLPVMPDDTYMTMAQAEKLTGEDLSAVRNFEPFFSEYDLTAKEYFLVLAALPFIEHEEGSALVLKEVKDSSEADAKNVSLYFEVEEPAQVVERNVEKYGDILSRLNINIDGSSFKALKRLAITVSSEDVQEIVMPTNRVSQEKLDFIEKIRELVRQLANLPSESPQVILDMVNRLLGGNMGNGN